MSRREIEIGHYCHGANAAITVFEGLNTGARLNSVEAAVVRVGDDDVGDEFAVGDDVIVEGRKRCQRC
jgi:hypothetical protein